MSQIDGNYRTDPRTDEEEKRAQEWAKKRTVEKIVATIHDPDRSLRLQMAATIFVGLMSQATNLKPIVQNPKGKSICEIAVVTASEMIEYDAQRRAAMEGK